MTIQVSIGPRLFRHGNPSSYNDIPAFIMMFQLGHVFSDMEIGNRRQDEQGLDRGFQLGHVFSDMEMQQNQPDERVATQVSIGPRLFRHGNLISCILWGYQSLRSFNWATSFQTWKSHKIPTLAFLLDEVSIGPRLFRHGNLSLRWQQSL